MLQVLIPRLLWVIPVALGVVTLTFFISRLFGGDPVELYLPTHADEELREAVRASMGLGGSLWDQYVAFLGGVVTGNLGTSFATGQPVSADLMDRLPATLELAVVALVIGIVTGVLFGVIAAVRKDRFSDFVIRAVSVGGMAVPGFWLALILILTFSVTLGWLPGPVGRLPIGNPGPPHVTGFYVVDSLLAGDVALALESVRHLLLPALTLAFLVFAPVARVTRNAMVEALGSDYIRTAIALGHSDRRIWFSYSLKNAMLPIITIGGEIIGFTLSGAVLIEAVYGWPGIGQYALTAITQSDFGALQGFVIYAALVYVFAYLLVDIAYMLVDPRTKVKRA